MIVVVESGFGFGSFRHCWERVEGVESWVHLHGYYIQPYERTNDSTARHSAVAVDRPAEDVDLARVSLTVSPERRVRVDSTEGVVTAALK